MSRMLPAGTRAARRFPRVSGDEPDLLDWGFCMVQFSPRERG